MKKDSIIFAITVTFVVSLILILISFIILYVGSQKREEHFMQKMNSDTTQMFFREYRHNGMSKELEEELQMMNFSIMSNIQEQNKILSDKKLIHLHKRTTRRAILEHLKLNGKYYVYIKTPRGDILLVNNNKSTNHQSTILSIFLVIFLAFTFLYITTLKKLKPLKVLKENVQKFGDEEFELDCATTKQDEISLLANEFSKSAKKLKNLKESRNIFIRNIMHELKTPITKGKFLTQLEHTEENSEKMQKVFYRLEALINEFASIEELISSKKVLDKKEYYLADVIDNAVDLLMCDEDNVVEKYENIKINIDFKLFSIAIKNLIDNGIKYSVDNKVFIKTDAKNIIFENRGKELSCELDKYYEPFFKGDNVQSNQSFGLGLYIVKNILNANEYNMKYKYVDGVNTFIIYQKKVII